MTVKDQLIGKKEASPGVIERINALHKDFSYFSVHQKHRLNKILEMAKDDQYKIGETTLNILGNYEDYLQEWKKNQLPAIRPSKFDIVFSFRSRDVVGFSLADWIISKLTDVEPYENEARVRHIKNFVREVFTKDLKIRQIFKTKITEYLVKKCSRSIEPKKLKEMCQECLSLLENSLKKTAQKIEPREDKIPQLAKMSMKELFSILTSSIKILFYNEKEIQFAQDRADQAIIKAIKEIEGAEKPSYLGLAKKLDCRVESLTKYIKTSQNEDVVTAFPNAQKQYLSSIPGLFNSATDDQLPSLIKRGLYPKLIGQAKEQIKQRVRKLIVDFIEKQDGLIKMESICQTSPFGQLSRQLIKEDEELQKLIKAKRAEYLEKCPLGELSKKYSTGGWTSYLSESEKSIVENRLKKAIEKAKKSVIRKLRKDKSFLAKSVAQELKLSDSTVIKLMDQAS